jgi:hypothetical protein
MPVEGYSGYINIRNPYQPEAEFHLEGELPEGEEPSHGEVWGMGCILGIDAYSGSPGGTCMGGFVYATMPHTCRTRVRILETYCIGYL